MGYPFAEQAILRLMKPVTQYSNEELVLLERIVEAFKIVKRHV